MDLGLRGKVALVIGATGGIGKAISLSLAKEGTNIIIHYYKNVKKAKAIKEELDEIGVKSIILKGNASKLDDCKYIIRESLQYFKKIDILVIALGKWPKESFLGASEEQWNQVMDINLKSAYFLIKEILPHMIQQKEGSIVAIGSECAWLGSTSGRADYAASKAGLLALSKTIAKKVGEFNIRVNVVAPGIIYTDMSKSEIDKKHDKYIERIPLGYIGRPEDVADVVTFLASNKARYITGSTVHVNGGMLML
ncbi:SDR family oxidoreductase [bacterium]|nr:SDR family oxidoreductase [bacterium]